MAKLGIDFGTANSAAAVVFDIDTKSPVTVEPSDGTLFLDLVFPSYVAFNKKGEFSVAGLLARERYFSGQSDLVIRHFKRLIGRPYDHVTEQLSKGNRAFSEFQGRIKRSSDGSILVTVGDRDISVVEVASYLLKKIIEDSQDLLHNRGENVDSVTISLPAGFDDSQRQATIEAANQAGLEGISIQVIEEPTAAAIARALGNIEGKIMVIDVGAGTTDVIIGHMEATRDGLQLIMTSRECDDVLGGIDMDHLILNYLFKNDLSLPKLEDIFHDLETDQRLRLLGKIEETKISASRDGNSALSIRLSVGKTESKQIHVPLDEDMLSDIVAPLINGYEVGNNHRKGIRPVIERALLKAAGGNLKTVPKVIEEIQWLILVGGPCRMSCMHEMLKDIFRNNPNLVMQISNIDKTDRFLKEGVAQGAALSQVKGMEVTTSVPWTVSIFHQSGVTPVIAAGTPYTRGQGTSRSVSIPVNSGSNLLWILSQKDSQPTRDWSMHSHIVNVPQEGKLKVNLKWGEGGVETDKASVEGCGLPGSIEFPQMSNTTTIGTELENRYKWYVTVAKDLRQLIELAREPLVRWLVPQVGTVREAEKLTDEWLRVPEYDLRQCDNINIDTEGILTDEDIDLAIKTGYFERRQQAAIERGLLTDRTAEVLDKVLPLLVNQTPATPDELINEANKLLSIGRNCSQCIQFWQQLSQWSHRLELTPNDHAVASAVATALGAFADCLFNQQVISSEDFSNVQDVCWRFHSEG